MRRQPPRKEEGGANDGVASLRLFPYPWFLGHYCRGYRAEVRGALPNKRTPLPDPSSSCPWGSPAAWALTTETTASLGKWGAFRKAHLRLHCQQERPLEATWPPATPMLTSKRSGSSEMAGRASGTRRGPSAPSQGSLTRPSGLCVQGQSSKWTESQRPVHSSSDMVPGSVPGFVQASTHQLASREGQ